MNNLNNLEANSTSKQEDIDLFADLKADINDEIDSITLCNCTWPCSCAD